MSIPPKLLEIRRRYMDKSVEASIAFQAGLITGGEFDSIIDLTADWYRLIRQLHGMTNAALERLTSNRPAIVEGLHKAGYHSLALQTGRDIEAVQRGGIGYNGGS